MKRLNVQRPTTTRRSTQRVLPLDVEHWMFSVGRFVLSLLFAATAFAQVPDAQPSRPPVVAASPQAPPPPTSSSKSSDSTSGGSKFLGKDVPIFDPTNELITWDGHGWNLNNNRVFEARFEKYLNAPEETSAQSQEYQNILRSILDQLSPEKLNSHAVDGAFRLLPRASNFEIDAHLCDAMADAVYSAGAHRMPASGSPPPTKRSNRNARSRNGMRRWRRSEPGWMDAAHEGSKRWRNGPRNSSSSAILPDAALHDAARRGAGHHQGQPG